MGLYSYESALWINHMGDFIDESNKLCYQDAPSSSPNFKNVQISKFTNVATCGGGGEGEGYKHY